MIQEITVDRNELIGIIEKNKQKHVQEYDTALKGYNKGIDKELNKLAKNLIPSATLGSQNELIGNLKELHPKKINLYDLSKIQKPDSHAADYDTVLKMLNLHKPNEFKLTFNDFNNFVEDNWSWSQTFHTSASGCALYLKD